VLPIAATSLLAMPLGTGITQSWIACFIALRYWDAANRAAAEFWVVCLLPTAVAAETPLLRTCAITDC
jgi:hypothetical protein